MSLFTGDPYKDINRLDLIVSTYMENENIDIFPRATDKIYAQRPDFKYLVGIIRMRDGDLEQFSRISGIPLAKSDSFYQHMIEDTCEQLRNGKVAPGVVSPRQRRKLQAKQMPPPKPVDTTPKPVIKHKPTKQPTINGKNFAVNPALRTKKQFKTVEQRVYSIMHKYNWPTLPGLRILMDVGASGLIEDLEQHGGAAAVRSKMDLRKPTEINWDHYQTKPKQA